MYAIQKEPELSITSCKCQQLKDGVTCGERENVPQLNLNLLSLLAVRRVLKYGGKPALTRLPLSLPHPTIGIEKRGAERLAPE